MSKRKEPLNVIVQFEEGEPSKEEQTRALFGFIAVILECCKDLLERNDKSLTEEDKKNIEDALQLFPYIKRIAEKKPDDYNTF